MDVLQLRFHQAIGRPNSPSRFDPAAGPHLAEVIVTHSFE